MAASRINPSTGFITNPVNNFMIRFGHLKAVVDVASPRSEPAEKLAKRLYERIGNRFNLPAGHNPSLSAYIAAKLFEGRKRRSRYPDLAFEQQAGQHILVWNAGPSKGQAVDSYPVECQDAYLADSSLPSNLGAVGRENALELVNWAGWLGLINGQRYSIQSMGQVLRILTPPIEKQAFSQFSTASNPYTVLRQRLFFLYLLLLTDGEILCRLYPRLLEMRKFSRMEAVAPFRDTLGEIRELLRRAGSLRYLQRMRELKNLTDTIETERTRSNLRGTRAITGMQRVSPRLENMVDIGILENTSANLYGLKLQYEYRINDLTEKFVRSIAPQAGRLDTFLSTEFFRAAAQVYGLKYRPASDPDVIFGLFVSAYQRFPRELGGKPIPMLSLVAAADALESGLGSFELSSVFPVLEEISKRHPGKVRMSGGHIGGRLEFVSIDDAIVESYRMRVGDAEVER